MTSKEALKQLRKYNSIGLCGDKTLFEPIEKGLEDLQTLKSFINNYLQFMLVYDDIDHYEIIPVQQYIGNSGCLLLTEEKMKKILDICND